MRFDLMNGQDFLCRLGRQLRTSGVLKMLVLFSSYFLLFFVVARHLTLRSAKFALEAIAPLMESVINAGLILRAMLIRNEIQVIGFVIATSVVFFLILAATTGNRWRTGMLNVALCCSVMGQYRILHWDHFQGALFHVLAGLLVIGFIRSRTLTEIDLSVDSKYRYLFLVLLTIVGFCTLYYRIDNWTPGQFKWSGQNMGDMLRFMIGDLHIDQQSLVWRQSLEAYSSDCVYYVLIMLAMIKHFGYQILTFRLVSTGIGGINIILTYLFFNKFFGSRIGLLTTGFMTVSSWHLLYARSETYVGFTITLPLAIFLFFLMGIHEKKMWAYSTAGILMGIMPSFYAVLRVLPFFIIGYIIVRTAVTEFRERHFHPNLFLSSFRREITRPLLFLLVPFGLFLLPQFFHLDQVISVYFGGRGEHVIHMANQPQMDILDKTLLVTEVILRNSSIIIRNLLGFDPDMLPIGYNKLMVSPISIFLVLGFFLTLVRIRDEFHLFMLLWLFFGTILAIGASHFTPARIVIALTPVAFFIATGTDSLYRAWGQLMGRFSVFITIAFSLALAMLGTMELTNFYPRYGELEKEAVTQPYLACEMIKAELKDSNIIMVFPTWDWAEEGFMRIYLYDWLQSNHQNRINLFFMTADFDQLAQWIRAGKYDEDRYLFMLESNPHETADKARLVLGAIRDHWPNLEPVEKDDWVWLFRTDE